jgi:hypothetical protein
MTERAPRIHLSLRVQPARLAALVDFYAQVFGVAPRKRYLDHVQFDLVEPPLNLTLTPTASAARGEIDHLGIQVFSEPALDAARARLVAAGLTPREEHAVDCCYARQSKFWVTDPEGREVEVFLKHADIEHHGRESGPAAPEDPAACCTSGRCETA